MDQSGYRFEVVDDLCKLAAEKSGKLALWAGQGNLKVVACYPRAVRSLFEAGGVTLEDGSVEFFNMRTGSAVEILEALGIAPGEDTHEAAEPQAGSEWVPWFPVIDTGRCIQCKQCMNFCLFQVYELTADKQVQVANPSHCKTNCPACARICPKQAIVFPKYSEGAICGEEIADSQGGQDQAGGSPQTLQGNAAYEALIRRTQDAKQATGGPAGSPVMDMKKLQEELRIPPEVLASLNPGEIMELRKKSEKPSE